jgi:hypothetical protein
LKREADGTDRSTAKENYKWHEKTAVKFLGIDHRAIVVDDTAASLNSSE